MNEYVFFAGIQNHIVMDAYGNANYQDSVFPPQDMTVSAMFAVKDLYSDWGPCAESVNWGASPACSDEMPTSQCPTNTVCLRVEPNSPAGHSHSPIFFIFLIFIFEMLGQAFAFLWRHSGRIVQGLLVLQQSIVQMGLCVLWMEDVLHCICMFGIHWTIILSAWSLVFWQVFVFVFVFV